MEGNGESAHRLHFRHRDPLTEFITKELTAQRAIQPMRTRLGCDLVVSRDVYACFLAVRTWQCVCDQFCVDLASLPDTV
jgi:hypothetical protein